MKTEKELIAIITENSDMQFTENDNRRFVSDKKFIQNQIDGIESFGITLKEFNQLKRDNVIIDSCVDDGMFHITINKLCFMDTGWKLADKSKLEVGDEVLVDNQIQTITTIENGGCIGEKIESKDYWLSNATLYTKSILKAHK